jgi:hypothetical protein
MNSGGLGRSAVGRVFTLDRFSVGEVAPTRCDLLFDKPARTALGAGALGAVE